MTDKLTEEQAVRIRDVAKQIQDILVENKMVMTPTISIGLVEDKPESLEDAGIILPPSGIVTPQNATEKDPLFQADFMK